MPEEINPVSPASAPEEVKVSEVVAPAEPAEASINGIPMSQLSSMQKDLRDLNLFSSSVLALVTQPSDEGRKQVPFAEILVRLREMVTVSDYFEKKYIALKMGIKE